MTSSASRPHVVIIGGGFGGLTAARAFRNVPVDVTVIDRNNHHTFQPLLYQVATATLNPSDITAPIRHILRYQRNTTVLLADVVRIDVGARTIAIDEGNGRERVIPYDYLIVASGARHSYFGHTTWENDAPGLKTIDDALEIRRRFLLAFELAELSEDPQEREALMTIVIVGGGPTGVELAGLMPDVLRGVRRDFRRIDPSRARIILIEGGPRLLPAFPEEISNRALADLREFGVDVRLNSVVTTVDQNRACVGDDCIATRNVFWAAGNVASPLGRFLDAPLDRAGRVKVNPDLSVPNHPEVFVIGDLATVTDVRGAPVPWVAPAANQEGKRAAENIKLLMRDEPTVKFKYLNKGNLATIGRYRAVADFGSFRVVGWLAWWFWLFVHILYLVGFRNRVSVLIQWAYSYFTYQRGVRLITQRDIARSESAAAH
ncbi:MAG TPA: NAD(P)/FAD-dependent oxidoreductase [Gemmatimonadaceae bacterium]|nr:NAD(P)/FAD-dependent oxidoreductase [Gemmatimonadaceae bacterium]